MSITVVRHTPQSLARTLKPRRLHVPSIVATKSKQQCLLSCRRHIYESQKIVRATSSPPHLLTICIRSVSHQQTVRELNQRGVDDALSDFDADDAKEKQVRTPWHREGVDTPPVRRQRSAGAMTMGTLPELS